MERRRITCPDTAHLEEIELERTRLGIVITRCSRFGEAAIECARECAARMDRRERDERCERVLVVHDGPVRAIAERLAAMLRRDDFAVELADASAVGMPPPEDYEAVVMLSPIRRRRFARATVDYIAEHRDALAAMPTFFASVSERPADDMRVLESMDVLWNRTGWRPCRGETFTAHADLEPQLRAFASRIADDVPSSD